MPNLKETRTKQGRSEKLQQVLSGCTFTYTKDKLGRTFMVDAPGGFVQEVYRKIMKGIKEILISQGHVNQEESVGNVMVVDTTVVGVAVQARVQMDDIVIITPIQNTDDKTVL